MTGQPMLEWRNRGVGGERVGALWDALQSLHASSVDEAYDVMWEEPEKALPLHRALLRLEAEALLRRADRLKPWMVDDGFEQYELAETALHELFMRMHHAMTAGVGRYRTPSSSSVPS